MTTSMKWITLLLLIAVAALAWQSHSQNLAIAELQRRIQDLTVKLGERANSEMLDLQDKCATQAGRLFREGGWSSLPLTGYTNHYNTALNRCFVEIETTDNNIALIGRGVSPPPSREDAGSVFENRYVYDVFEGKEYAEYMWKANRNGNSPLACIVTLPSGDKKQCTSENEFEELIRVYMR